MMGLSFLLLSFCCGEADPVPRELEALSFHLRLSAKELIGILLFLLYVSCAPSVPPGLFDPINAEVVRTFFPLFSPISWPNTLLALLQRNFFAFFFCFAAASP